MLVVVGVSMVACTFSVRHAELVTDIVRSRAWGQLGWWAFLRRA
jgi:hypothetical protein